MATLEIIGEIGAFIILLITIFTLYGKVIKDYTKLKSDVAQLQDNYLVLQVEISRIAKERNDDYNTIMSKIANIDLKNVEANAKQFEKLSKQIDDNFKLILDKIK